ncbi:hypothetical protein KSZ_77050 [Dictyobacter formicarum]|uniref:Uncharacterized protein n=1 Tax=Dictyobacter formicarum TaxID=2778368 RepID=A0ABQ3VTU6_9CHLR|nr:hypothetical protein KSZ_77050 [Dictyobacter formicarum]
MFRFSFATMRLMKEISFLDELTAVFKARQEDKGGILLIFEFVCIWIHHCLTQVT